MNDWKHCTGFVAKIMKVPTRDFHTCRSCMSLHTSWLLSEWVTLNIAWPGSMTTCRSIQAKDRDLSGDWRWDIVPKISQNSIDRLTNVFRASGSLFSDKSILSIKNQTWFLFCLCCVLVWNPRKQCPRAGTMVSCWSRTRTRDAAKAAYFMGDVLLDSNHTRLSVASW